MTSVLKLPTNNLILKRAMKSERYIFVKIYLLDFHIVVRIFAQPTQS